MNRFSPRSPAALRRRVVAAAVATTLSALSSLAAAAYPCAPLRVVSPYPPGGTTDVLARLIAPGLAKGLGVPVIVENKAGASSNVGTEAVVRAPTDGCTALLGNNTGVVINRNLYKLKYDPAHDLAAVGMVASTPLVLYINADVPARSVAELIELLKKSPGKYSYPSGGSGSPQHLMGEMLKLERGVNMAHIPYRGQGPALSDVLAGHVPIAFETTTAIAPHVRSPRIRLLAVTSDKRLPSLPDVPTMAEAGLKDFVVENWYGLFVPAKTPAPLVQQLNEELVRVLRSPEVAGKLADLGSHDVSGTPEQLRQFISRELPRWEGVVKRSGATVD